MLYQQKMINNKLIHVKSSVSDKKMKWFPRVDLWDSVTKNEQKNAFKNGWIFRKCRTQILMYMRTIFGCAKIVWKVHYKVQKIDKEKNVFF